MVEKVRLILLANTSCSLVKNTRFLCRGFDFEVEFFMVPIFWVASFAEIYYFELKCVEYAQETMKVLKIKLT